MGVLQAGLLNQSSAQVIDGSLKFDATKSQGLKRTFSLGNRKTWTWSGWVKKLKNPSSEFILFGCYTSVDIYTLIRTRGTQALALDTDNGPTSYYNITSRLLRDTNSWYHIVVAVDTNLSSAEQIKFYINGVRETSLSTSQGITSDTFINRAEVHGIGLLTELNNYGPIDAHMSQVYFIDGQALGPENFGFTDPLTGTWRPKKYTGTFTGTNTFYLPLDGNSPIGQDKSGNGNDWTPVNFGGSVELDKATGALPILNTLGGTVARPGVFGSEVGAYYAVTVPGGIGGGFYLDGTQKPALNLIRGATYTFDQSDSSNSSHPLVFGTTADGNDYSDGVTTNGTPGSAGAYTKITVPHNAPDTLYYHCSAHGGMGSSTSQTTDETKADPYAWKNTLALPLVGSANDVSNQINSGSTTKTVAVTGATASSTQSNLYGGSYYFNGPTDGASSATHYAVISDSNNEFAFGTGDFTMEFWVWGTDWTGGSANQDQVIFGHDGVNYAGFYIPAGVFAYYTGSAYIPSSNKPTLQDNKWYHVAVSRESGTSRVFLDGILVGSASDTTNHPTGSIKLATNPSNDKNQFNGYLQDVRVYKGVAKYTSNFIPASTSPDILPDTPSGVSGSSKLTKITDGAVTFDGSGDSLSLSHDADFIFDTTFTIECFFYLNSLPGSGNETIISKLNSGGGNQSWDVRANANGTITTQLQFTSSYEAASSSSVGTKRWHHYACSVNSGTVKIFLDGKEVGSGSVSGSMTNSTSTPVRIGSGYNTNLDGFVSNVRIIKGTALYTSNFTPPTRALTDVTNTKLLCCQSPTSATAAAVTPGSITANGNAAATNFNPFTTDINTVRGQETGYATLNPLDLEDFTLSNGNLNYSKTSTSWKSVRATQGVNSGKWYYEFQFGSDNRNYIGISQSSFDVGSYPGATSTSYSIYLYNGYKSNNASDSAYASAFASTDVLGVAFDLDASTITFYKNGISLGVAFTGVASGYYFPTFSTYPSGENGYVNFGQKPFKFPPPDGYQPLNAANVRPETVIVRPDQYVGISTWTADGTQPLSITNYNFKPDLIWMKSRSNAYNHHIHDSVRGINNFLVSNNTGAEDTQSDTVTSFDPNGFTMGTNSNGNYTGTGGATHVGWCWKAGGNKNTFNVDDVGYASAAAAGLTAGTITPTGASVNTKSGFSIIKSTLGTASGNITIPHGLQKTPDFIIAKSLTNTYNWDIYHKDATPGGQNRLIFTSAGVDANDPWGNVAPTSSVFTFNAGFYADASDSVIFYSWADVPGLQKFGSYTGNGSTDGVFVELGFRPALVLMKKTTGTSNWFMHDSGRNTYNPMTGIIMANLANQEDNSYDYIDFLSNGFKLRFQNVDYNTTSQTYIYAAWAEAPSFNLYGGQSNAR